MELMITIAVLVILTAATLPSFLTAIQDNRVTGQANELVATMQFARSEALKRGVRVEICSSTDGASCAGDWAEGWIARCPGDNCCLVDTDPSDPDLDCGGADDDLLRAWPGTGADFDFDPENGLIAYQPNGFADGAFAIQLTPANCVSNEERARLITVAASGRAASQRVICP